MEIGVGLPTTLPDAPGRAIIEWATAADQAGFSSLGTLDRLVYPNHEPLLSLAAAAAVTERIRLATTILIGPLRPNAALLGKQVATLQSLSGGRLVLGLAAGSRADDYEAGGVDFGTRGQALDDQLAVLRSVLSAGEASPLGSVAPAGRERPPQILIGGQSAPAIRRVVDVADGWISGGGGPPMFRHGAEAVTEAWERSGRSGRPRLVAIGYFALGAGASDNARASLGDYYRFLPPPLVDRVVAGASTSEEELTRAVAAFADAGCDELLLFPCSWDIQQVKLLASAVLGG